MPLHLPPVSRRSFLRTVLQAGAGGTALAAGAGCCGFRPRRLFVPDSDTRWALFSDTHIAADPATIGRDVNMTAHLKAALREVLSLAHRPAGLMVNGDCAYLSGETGDYANFAGIMKSATDAGLPVHLTLGNHDHRERIRAGVAAAGGPSPVEGKSVSVVETSHANWFLLDSLEKVNNTPGRLEQAQRDWLAAALDARRDKPALVMLHHNPQPLPAGDTSTKVTGLLDTAELMTLLLPRRQVKALFFGHTHVWSLKQQEGLHLVNLPAVAYVFAKTQPSGWVDCLLAQGGMSLELRSLDPQHPEHGKKNELAWRT